MLYPSVLYERARQLQIDIDEPSGRGFLLVCRDMLAGMWQLLGTDLRQVIILLDNLEYELREISNAFNQMQLHNAQLAISLKKCKYIKSLEGILLGVDEAYSHVFAAIQVCAEGGNEAKVHFEVAKSLKACRTALTRTLQQICVN